MPPPLCVNRSGFMKSLVLGCIGCCLAGNALSATTSAQWCEEQWKAASAAAVDQQPPDYAGLLHQWQQLGARCAGTVAYEARLASAYVFLGRPEKAREVLAPFKDVPSPYRHLVDFMLIQADAQDITKGRITIQDVEKLEKMYANLVSRYPEFPTPMQCSAGSRPRLTSTSKRSNRLKWDCSPPWTCGACIET